MSELLVDDEYKNIRIKIDNQIVATQEIIDRVSIAFGCTDGSAPAVGTTYSPHCDVEINSNEIYGDSRLDAIKMGAIFVVECELESGTYTPLGRFEIGQPVQITDDYAISFSGEGMLGSVLARKKMNWANMQQYSDKGVLTVAEALELVHIQFPTITIQTPSSEHLPDDFSEARIVVPTSLKKWKKNVIYKKRFVKITVRDFLAGIAVMMGGNVVEYGNSIRIVTMSEARENEGAMIGNYFSSDSFASDFTYERKVYVPKEMCLKTYETTPVQTKKKSGSTKTHGYCYTTECECASVYKYEGAPSVHKYTINVDCQWIGRSFEAFYFSGSVSGDSGEYEDAEPIRTYPLIDFNYLPCSIDFSGWNDLFCPATFVNIHATRKNTATQEETPFDVLVYIMDMTLEWNGTISVSVSSGYNGDSNEITVTIGTNELSNAWDDGTNVPELATIIDPYPPTPDVNYTFISKIPSSSNSNLYIRCATLNNELYVAYSSNSNYTTTNFVKYNGNSWTQLSFPVDGVPHQDKYSVMISYNNKIHFFEQGGSHYEWDGERFTQSFAPPRYKKGNNYYNIRFANYGAVVFNGELYISGYVSVNYYSGDFHWVLYKYDGNQWELLDDTELPNTSSGSNVGFLPSLVSHNGYIYGLLNADTSISDYKSLYRWEGSYWNKLGFPTDTIRRCLCEYNGFLYSFYFYYGTGTVSVLEDFENTWISDTSTWGNSMVCFVIEYNGLLYMIDEGCNLFSITVD